MKKQRISMTLRLIAAAVLAGGLSAGVALAQNEDDDQEPDADVRFRRESNLTGPEQVSRGEQYLQGMRSSDRVQTMPGAACRERDIIKVTCLNDKLTQIDVNSRTARDRLESLRGAVGRNDDAARNHEFTIMSVLKQKIDTLSLEADQCAGIEGDVFGRPTLEVEIARHADEDPTELRIRDSSSTGRLPAGAANPAATHAAPLGAEVAPVGR
jgi:hypothetical protein